MIRLTTDRATVDAARVALAAHCEDAKKVFQQACAMDFWHAVESFAQPIYILGMISDLYASIAGKEDDPNAMAIWLTKVQLLQSIYEGCGGELENIIAQLRQPAGRAVFADQINPAAPADRTSDRRETADIRR